MTRLHAETVGALDPIARGAAAVAAVRAALPSPADLRQELACVDAAMARGYFLPDEEAVVRTRYASYLASRAALLQTLDSLARHAGNRESDWAGRLPAFAAAFASACVLMRATRFLLEMASDRPVVWKKLDEPDARLGLGRKSFSVLYREACGTRTLFRFLAAADFYFAHREEIAGLHRDPVVGEVVEILLDEEPAIERRRRDALRRHLGYRWYSFLRRGRSAWRQTMFGLFEVSGRAIANLRQPGVKSAGAPKRIAPETVARVIALARPGDVFVTRHDDALSNLFLPGFWPHAALFVGNNPEGGPWFLEAKKDGVRYRAPSETLHVDAFAVLRPPLRDAEIPAALARAAEHAGKPYDFLFDFRTADRLACTEVVYRAMHGTGPVRFELREVGGRLCLPAEELIDQAFDCGFRVVAAGGIGRGGLLTGSPAEIAFHGSRQPV